MCQYYLLLAGLIRLTDSPFRRAFISGLVGAMSTTRGFSFATNQALKSGYRRRGCVLESSNNLNPVNDFSTAYLGCVTVPQEIVSHQDMGDEQLRKGFNSNQTISLCFFKMLVISDWLLSAMCRRRWRCRNVESE
jgi:hypothetical protein